MKRRIAIWLYGGIGTGNFSQGQPVLERVVRQLGVEFEIVVYSQWAPNKDFQPLGFVVKSAPEAIRPAALRWMFLAGYFFADHRRRKFALISAFWGFPGGFIATLLSKLLFLPSIVNLQGGDSIGIPNLGYGIMNQSLYRSLARWTYRQATIVTVLTSFQRDQLKRYGVVRPVTIIPFGANKDLFDLKKDEPVRDSAVHFIHISNYNAVKDVETLIRAFAIFSKKKSSFLRIVGGEYMASPCPAMVTALGIQDQVEFCGPVAYEGIKEHLRWADAMLHTSVYEGQGIVIAEGAMSGLLIAGTDVGLISDLGDAAAVIVPVGDYHSLSVKLAAILDDRDLREKKIRAAKNWALQHDFVWTVDQHRRTINDLVNE